MADPDLQEGFMACENTVFEDGERVFSELNTGDWWHDTEREKPEVYNARCYIQRYNGYYLFQGSTLLPILLYLDGTHLSKNSSHTIKPLSMSLGNFPIRQMNKTHAKKVIIYIFHYVQHYMQHYEFMQLLAYVPELKAPKKQTDSANFRHAKRYVYQEVIRKVLKSIAECHKKGGFHCERVRATSRCL